MVGRYGLELAISLIRSHFGDLVAKVCGCLLHRGTLTLEEAIRFSELDPYNVRRCLLVLIQHNCVQAFSAPIRAGPGAARKTRYIALFDNILHRLRFAKFLAIVKNDKNLDPECETLFVGLLQHGRLTFDQLVGRAAIKEPNASRDILDTRFNKLVHARYVERCPKAEPFIEPDSDGETTAAKKRASKLAKPSIEQQAIIAASLSDVERFSGISGTDNGTNEDAKATEHCPSVSIGDKRKHNALEDDDVQVTMNENEILWRANFEMFIHRLKMEACIRNTRSRLGAEAATVLEAMTESNCEQNAKDNNSVTTPIDAIFRGVAEKSAGNVMTLEDVRAVLEQLGCHLCTEETGALYTIDLKGIIQTCQKDEVETVVLKRYGKEACRIFRLLADQGRPFETDKIAQTSCVEKKDSLGILYKLWQDNYLAMKNLTMQGSSHTHFLWVVKRAELWDHILNDMYHAALNVSQRAAYMIEQDPEILVPRAAWPETAQQKRWAALESSLSKLDDTIMLFTVF